MWNLDEQTARLKIKICNESSTNETIWRRNITYIHVCNCKKKKKKKNFLMIDRPVYVVSPAAGVITVCIGQQILQPRHASPSLCRWKGDRNETRLARRRKSDEKRQVHVEASARPPVIFSRPVGRSSLGITCRWTVNQELIIEPCSCSLSLSEFRVALLLRLCCRTVGRIGNSGDTRGKHSHCDTCF